MCHIYLFVWAVQKFQKFPQNKAVLFLHGWLCWFCFKNNWNLKWQKLGPISCFNFRERMGRWDLKRKTCVKRKIQNSQIASTEKTFILNKYEPSCHSLLPSNYSSFLLILFYPVKGTFQLLRLLVVSALELSLFWLTSSVRVDAVAGIMLTSAHVHIAVSIWLRR